MPITEVHGLDPVHVLDADTPEDLIAALRRTPGPADSLAPMDVPEIDVTQLAAERAAGASLIDVRQDHEFAEVHVPGAHHIPLGDLVERIDEVPTEGTVYVICAVGSRSAKAVGTSGRWGSTP